MQQEPEFLFDNGNFWTGDESKPWAHSISVSNGRIAEVSREVSSSPSASTRSIDLNDHFAMPGFIDSHTHFRMGGASLRQIDLRNAQSEDEFAMRVKLHIESHPDERWIVGGNWDHENWKSHALPTKKLIDRFTPDRAVFLNRIDTHLALVNSRALEMAAITSKTPDPPGGVIVRDESGEPTGIVKDAAREMVAKIIPEPSLDDCILDLKAAMAHASRLGVTTVHDISPLRDLKAVNELKRRGELSVRFYFIPPLHDYTMLVNHGIEAGRKWRCDDWLKFGAVKAFADGSLGAGTAWFFEPYEDDATNSGLATDSMSDGEIEKLAMIADRNHIQLAIHAIGDKAVSRVLDLFEKIRNENPPWERRFRIEHAQHIVEKDFRRFRETGVTASVQPYHCIDDGRWAVRKIGTQRMKNTYAFRRFLDEGIPLALGTDWPVAPLNPLEGIYAAVTRATLDGRNPEGWVPEEKIGLTDALRWYTFGGAAASFCENEVGSLKPGMLADVVVLSHNPFDVNPEEIRNIKVLMTVVGGNIVHAAGEFEEYGERKNN